MGLSERVRELVGADLDVDDLAHPPLGDAWACEASHDGVRLTVAYVAHDDYPPSGLHDGTGGRGAAMRYDGTAAGRSRVADFVEEARRRGAALFAAPFSDPSSPGRVDGAPPDGASLLWRGPDASAAHATDRATAALELRAYAAWLADDLCGIITEVFMADGHGGLTPVDQSADWPRVARSDAEALLADAVAARAGHESPSP